MGIGRQPGRHYLGRGRGMRVVVLCSAMGAGAGATGLRIHKYTCIFGCGSQIHGYLWYNTPVFYLSPRQFSVVSPSRRPDGPKEAA